MTPLSAASGVVVLFRGVRDRFALLRYCYWSVLFLVALYTCYLFVVIVVRFIG